jgi:hypothetical protein
MSIADKNMPSSPVLKLALLILASAVCAASDGWNLTFEVCVCARVCLCFCDSLYLLVRGFSLAYTCATLDRTPSMARPSTHLTGT